MCAFACAFAVTTTVGAKPVPEAVEKTIQTISPGKVDGVTPSGLPGFYEVRKGAFIYYVSDDGEHVLYGDIINMRSRVNYTKEARQKHVLSELKTIKDRLITFAPKKEKYRIVVVTDINCGYCRKFHADMPTLHRLGIRVDYLPVAYQGGDKGYDASVSVWCSPDRKQAMHTAKTGGYVKSAECKHPLEENSDFANALGMRGTPFMFLPDGSVVGGYVPPERLLVRLQEIS